LLSGCTTKGAKKALNKPYEEDAYAGFAKEYGKDSDRHAAKPEPVSDEMNPEKAVGILVDHMQRRALQYQIPAEQELRYWATKQGVREIVVRKVRSLLKNPRVEVRAPALRLTITYGSNESNGDLIEVLGDSEYGMRDTAFKALRMRTGRDFGFNPAGGSLARAKAIEAWRRWWQDEQRKRIVQQTAVREVPGTPPPRIIVPPPSRHGPREEGSAKNEKGRAKKFYAPDGKKLPPPEPAKE